MNECTPRLNGGKIARTLAQEESSKMCPYKTKSTKDELIDAITNLIDESIRKGRCEDYSEWQAAVEKLLTEHEEK